MSETRGWRVLGPWPFAVLGLLAAGFALMLVFSRKAPVIASLDPPMAAPGQTVVVTGEYFGRTEREGSLSLAGEIPPPSLIQSWSDQRIVFVVPEDATSGLVTVANTQGVSRGVLFTNTQSIPTVLQAAGAPGLPLVWSVAPARVQAGQIVTLAGRRFGPGDEGSSVELSGAGGGPVWLVGPRDAVSWGDHEIAFRVPGGVSGVSVRVKTPRGESSSLPLDVGGPISLVDPRTVLVDFRWEVKAQGGKTRGPMTVWGPVPQDATGTVWTLVSSEPQPVTSLRPLTFASGRTESRGTYRLQLTTWTRRWDGFPAGTVPTGSAPAGSPGPSAFWKGVPGLKALTAKWGLETPDPWLRIQRIQTGLGAWTPVLVPLSPRTPEQILASPQADTRELSTLALAVAAQVGIPGRLVSGLWLAPSNKVVSRYWAEVWVAGAGWVPWDVADGAPGNLDNRHFALEVAESVVPRLLPDSQTVGPVVPGTLKMPSAEVGNSVGDLLVSWEITLAEK